MGLLVQDHDLHPAKSSMRRRVIAAVWITGSTVPLLLATVFVFGCCVLPFHEIAHKLMPVCDMAASMMRGDSAGSDHHQHEATPPPAREKQEPVKRMATEVPLVFRLAALPAAERLGAQNAATGYRSFIALGAIRCDQDVGLHVLVETFLI
jgi:hypothetical protein